MSVQRHFLVPFAHIQVCKPENPNAARITARFGQRFVV
jgi:hypothetical protein